MIYDEINGFRDKIKSTEIVLSLTLLSESTFINFKYTGNYTIRYNTLMLKESNSFMGNIYQVPKFQTIVFQTIVLKNSTNDIKLHR